MLKNIRYLILHRIYLEDEFVYDNLLKVLQLVSFRIMWLGIFPLLWLKVGPVVTKPKIELNYPVINLEVEYWDVLSPVDELTVLWELIVLTGSF